MTTSLESAPADKSALEDGADLTPRFDANGLVTAVVTDSRDNAVLMLAHMNDEALRLTIETGVAHYWSRSRNQLWKKGETSGNLQMVDEIRVDCDQDAVLLKVRVSGADATCHTGRRSCFYRKVVTSEGNICLEIDSEPLFDPASVYTDH
ncbi:phosphoribosyl-AMP cyclohydrolase [Hoeflea sp. AS60]|uniref:phosphoribosyl-AMP cyclohydrolase n=1 Tax=Hoeflea sp. AS60 TaxID=3135780 RepID=UPI00316D4415